MKNTQNDFIEFDNQSREIKIMNSKQQKVILVKQDVITVVSIHNDK